MKVCISSVNRNSPETSRRPTQQAGDSDDICEALNSEFHMSDQCVNLDEDAGEE